MRACVCAWEREKASSPLLAPSVFFGLLVEANTNEASSNKQFVLSVYEGRKEGKGLRLLQLQQSAQSAVETLDSFFTPPNR